MSLLRTKAISVGSVLAFTGVSPEDGHTFIYGPPEFSLERGDVVKIIDIDKAREAETPHAKVTVACLKGKFVGRVGVVSIDLSTRYQRSWQCLTHSGSMQATRVPKVRKTSGSYSIVDREKVDQDAPTAPAPTAEVTRGGSKKGGNKVA